MRRLLFLATLGVTCTLGTARAAQLQVVFEQVGANVVATGSGSLPDLNGLSFSFNSNSTPLINPAPQGPNVRVGATATADFYLGDFVVTGSLGSINLTTTANSGSGPIFGYTGSFLALPVSYSTGTQLTSTATWTNTTFEALGLTPGATANITWGSGARSMAVSVVPEPSTWAMGAGGLACAAWGAWGRRKRAADHGPVVRSP